MKYADKSLSQIIGTLKEEQNELNALQSQLVACAREQEAIENQYNALVVLAAQGVDLLSELQFGDVVSQDWKTRADEITQQVQPYL